MSMDVSRLLSLAVAYSRQNDLPVHFDRYRQFLDELDGIHRHPFVAALEKRSQIPIDLILQRFFRFSRTPQMRHQRRPHPCNWYLQWLLSLTGTAPISVGAKPSLERNSTFQDRLVKRVQ